MMPRRLLLLTAAAALFVASSLGGANADTPGPCPSLATQASIRKTVAGGKSAVLTFKVSNTGADPVNDAGVFIRLPYGATYQSVRVSPKLSSAPTFEQQGGMIAWTGIPINAHKTRTLRIKSAFDKCAGSLHVAPKSANGKPTGLFNTTIELAVFRVRPTITIVSALTMPR